MGGTRTRDLWLVKRVNNPLSICKNKTSIFDVNQRVSIINSENQHKFNLLARYRYKSCCVYFTLKYLNVVKNFVKWPSHFYLIFWIVLFLFISSFAKKKNLLVILSPYFVYILKKNNVFNILFNFLNIHTKKYIFKTNTLLENFLGDKTWKLTFHVSPRHHSYIVCVIFI